MRHRHFLPFAHRADIALSEMKRDELTKSAPKLSAKILSNFQNLLQNVFWPDFTDQHLYEAILNYQKRERRFGKTSEQLK